MRYLLSGPRKMFPKTSNEEKTILLQQCLGACADPESFVMVGGPGQF